MLKENENYEYINYLTELGIIFTAVVTFFNKQA